MRDIIITSLFVFGVMTILCTDIFTFKKKKNTNEETKIRQAAPKRSETEKTVSKWNHFAKYSKKARTRKKYKDRLSVFYIWYLFDFKEARDE